MPRVAEIFFCLPDIGSDKQVSSASPTKLLSDPVFQVLSFADDLVILLKSHGLQNALKKLQSYCYKWQLIVNTKKN